MASIGDFLKSNAVYLVSAFVVAAIFRNQIKDFGMKMAGSVLKKELAKLEDETEWNFKFLISKKTRWNQSCPHLQIFSSLEFKI